MFRKKRNKSSDTDLPDEMKKFIEDLRNISTKVAQAPTIQSDYWFFNGVSEHGYGDDSNECFPEMHTHVHLNMPIDIESINKKKIKQRAVDELMNIINDACSRSIKEQRV